MMGVWVGWGNRGGYSRRSVLQSVLILPQGMNYVEYAVDMECKFVADRRETVVLMLAGLQASRRCFSSS